MRPRSLLAELRHRGVLKVATAYLASGWVILQGVGFLFQSFGAPAWALKALITVVLLGFPLACLMAWLRKVEGRFPFLKGRVTPLLVPGGTSGGSFDDPETARTIRGEVEALLGLSQGGRG
jgi:hypothetical protein